MNITTQSKAYDEDEEIVRQPLHKEDKHGPTATEKTGPNVSEVLIDKAGGKRTAVDFWGNY